MPKQRVRAGKSYERSELDLDADSNTPTETERLRGKKIILNYPHEKTDLFIHGGSAYSSYDTYLSHLRNTPLREPIFYKGSKKRWKKTLFTELGETHDVLYISMPNSENAKYDEWKMWFERHFEYLNGEVILIGHSHGGIFLSKYLSENSPAINIKALFLIAAPFKAVDYNGEDGGDFILDETKVSNIGMKCSQINVFHSKDDPIVPVSHGTMYKNALLSANYIEFNDRGHFLQENFPEIIENIQNLD